MFDKSTVFKLKQFVDVSFYKPHLFNAPCMFDLSVRNANYILIAGKKYSKKKHKFYVISVRISSVDLCLSCV